MNTYIKEHNYISLILCCFGLPKSLATSTSKESFLFYLEASQPRSCSVDTVHTLFLYRSIWWETDLLFKAGYRGGTDHTTNSKLEEVVTNNDSTKENKNFGSPCIHHTETRSSFFSLSTHHNTHKIKVPLFQFSWNRPFSSHTVPGRLFGETFSNLSLFILFHSSPQTFLVLKHCPYL